LLQLAATLEETSISVVYPVESSFSKSLEKQFCINKTEPSSIHNTNISEIQTLLYSARPTKQRRSNDKYLKVTHNPVGRRVLSKQLANTKAKNNIQFINSADDFSCFVKHSKQIGKDIPAIYNEDFTPARTCLFHMKFSQKVVSIILASGKALALLQRYLESRFAMLPDSYYFKSDGHIVTYNTSFHLPNIFLTLHFTGKGGMLTSTEESTDSKGKNEKEYQEPQITSKNKEFIVNLLRKEKNNTLTPRNTEHLSKLCDKYPEQFEKIMNETETEDSHNDSNYNSSGLDAQRREENLKKKLSHKKLEPTKFQQKMMNNFKDAQNLSDSITSYCSNSDIQENQPNVGTINPQDISTTKNFEKKKLLNFQAKDTILDDDFDLLDFDYELPKNFLFKITKKTKIALGTLPKFAIRFINLATAAQGHLINLQNLKILLQKHNPHIIYFSEHIIKNVDVNFYWENVEAYFSSVQHERNTEETREFLSLISNTRKKNNERIKDESDFGLSFVNIFKVSNSLYKSLGDVLAAKILALRLPNIAIKKTEIFLGVPRNGFGPDDDSDDSDDDSNGPDSKLDSELPSDAVYSPLLTRETPTYDPFQEDDSLMPTIKATEDYKEQIRLAMLEGLAKIKRAKINTDPIPVMEPSQDTEDLTDSLERIGASLDALSSEFTTETESPSTKNSAETETDVSSEPILIPKRTTKHMRILKKIGFFSNSEEMPKRKKKQKETPDPTPPDSKDTSEDSLKMKPKVVVVRRQPEVNRAAPTASPQRRKRKKKDDGKMTIFPSFPKFSMYFEEIVKIFPGGAYVIGKIDDWVHGSTHRKRWHLNSMKHHFFKRVEKHRVYNESTDELNSSYYAYSNSSDIMPENGMSVANVLPSGHYLSCVQLPIIKKSVREDYIWPHMDNTLNPLTIKQGVRKFWPLLFPINNLVSYDDTFENFRATVYCRLLIPKTFGPLPGEWEKITSDLETFVFDYQPDPHNWYKALTTYQKTQIDRHIDALEQGKIIDTATKVFLKGRELLKKEDKGYGRLIFNVSTKYLLLLGDFLNQLSKAMVSNQFPSIPKFSISDTIAFHYASSFSDVNLNEFVNAAMNSNNKKFVLVLGDDTLVIDRDNKLFIETDYSAFDSTQTKGGALDLFPKFLNKMGFPLEAGYYEQMYTEKINWRHKSGEKLEMPEGYETPPWKMSGDPGTGITNSQANIYATRAVLEEISTYEKLGLVVKRKLKQNLSEVTFLKGCFLQNKEQSYSWLRLPSFILKLKSFTDPKLIYNKNWTMQRCEQQLLWSQWLGYGYLNSNWFYVALTATVRNLCPLASNIELLEEYRVYSSYTKRYEIDDYVFNTFMLERYSITEEEMQHFLQFLKNEITSIPAIYTHSLVEKLTIDL